MRHAKALLLVDDAQPQVLKFDVLLYQTVGADDDVDLAAALIGKFDIIPEAVAKIALPYCQIVYIDGEDMRTQLSGYLQVLYDQNPDSVGKALPDEDFYYQR